MSYPTKAEQEQLWKAICAITYKSDLHTPYAHVLVSERDIVATNGYVACLVHNMYQPGLLMPRIHANEIMSEPAVAAARLRSVVRNAITEFAAGDTFVAQILDARLLKMALRPHVAFRDARIYIGGSLSARLSNPVVLLQSIRDTSGEPITITTIIIDR